MSVFLHRAKWSPETIFIIVRFFESLEVFVFGSFVFFTVPRGPRTLYGRLLEGRLWKSGGSARADMLGKPVCPRVFFSGGVFFSPMRKAAPEFLDPWILAK